MKQTILTGVKPTGVPHIGNYLGAIKPAIDLTKDNEYNYFYFIADYHSLNMISNAENLKEYTLEIACTWLACGLDPEKVVFYRQSDIPEVFELQSILSNITPKGLINRAHAYKAMIEDNKQNGKEEEDGVNMGLFNYPILMASDILLFNTQFVPVGEDNRQHVEITRDIAQYFNKKYGNNLVIPSPLIGKNIGIVMGLDGRKMSKSYSNTIELFLPENLLKKKINKIVTDSKGIDEPKGTDNLVFEFYKVFAGKEQTKLFESKLASGISWGEAKKELFEVINANLTPIREKYNYYKQNPKLVEQILADGAQKARPVAKETLLRVRKAIGVN